VIHRHAVPMRAAGAILASLVLALAAGCAKEKAAGGFAMPPMPVVTATATPTAMTDSYTAVGTFEATEQVVVTAEIDGLVVELPFREGGALRRGDLIARIDDAQTRAEAERAEARVAQSRAAFDRVRSVVDQGAGAPQDLDDAAAALKVAEADLAVARARLAKTRIVAAFDGTAGTRRVSRGAFVRTGDAITELARLDRLRLLFAVPERYLGALRQGATVAVRTTAYPDLVLSGALAVVEPVVDAATRSVGVVALVDNAEGRLRPGMSAEASVVLDERPAALALPSEAVIAQGDRMLVYVIQPDSTVAPVPVTLGLRTASLVEIVEGLAPGALVVRAGHQKIFPGAHVIPLPAGDAPAAGGGPR
jgi:membrane fusion protein, multidrug efflux system